MDISPVNTVISGVQGFRPSSSANALLTSSLLTATIALAVAFGPMLLQNIKQHLTPRRAAEFAPQAAEKGKKTEVDEKEMSKNPLVALPLCKGDASVFRGGEVGVGNDGAAPALPIEETKNEEVGDAISGVHEKENERAEKVESPLTPYMGSAVDNKE